MTRFLLILVAFLATETVASACHFGKRRQATPQVQACQTQVVATPTYTPPTRTVGGGILGVPVRIVRAVVAPLTCTSGTCPTR